MGRRRRKQEFNIPNEKLQQEAYSNDFFELRESPTMGRYIVAKEDLEAGTIFLEDEPLAVGPTLGGSPVCIACCTPVDISSAPKCPGCQWPICRTDCDKFISNQWHSAEECRILEKSNNFKNDCYCYNGLFPLRILLLRKTNEKGWGIVKSMESHNKFRQKSDDWQLDKTVIDFIKKCDIQDVTEEEIHSICGFIQVNAFAIERTDGSGLYPTAFLLSHDCVPNTTHMIDSQHKMHIRTTTPVAAGEPLVLSYCNTIQGTLGRRLELKKAKYFDCVCKRCSDPTELQTFMEAVKCEKCSKGYVIPLNSLDSSANWQCNKCKNIVPVLDVCKKVNRISKEADILQCEDIPGMEAFLNTYKNQLHPNHYFLAATKLRLSQLYGKLPEYLINIMPGEQLFRKKELCKEMLTLFNVIEPGLSRIRGVTLYELHAPALLVASHQFQKTQNKTRFSKDLKEVKSYLQEAITILRFEDPRSPEGKMARAAEEAFHQLNKHK